MKHILSLMAFMLIFSPVSYAQEVEDRGNEYEEESYQDGYQNEGPHKHNLSEWEESQHRYFKASFGTSTLGDYSDFSGDIEFEGSSFLPLNFAAGATKGHAAFEIELGLSHNDFDFVPFDLSEGIGFGDLSAAKLMFNWMYRTSNIDSNFYVGGGLGLLSVTLDGIEQEMSGSSFAAQLILGGEFRTNERTGFFVEYKNFTSLGLELENDFTVLDFDFEESSLNFGWRLYF